MDSEAFAAVPGWQNAHPVLPASDEKLPGEQAEQLGAPDIKENEPAVQGEQLEEAGLAEKKPTGHVEHVAAPASLNEPEGQSMQAAELLKGEKVPAAQLSHEVLAGAAAVLPGEHCKQTVCPGEVTNFPIGQGVQVDAPGLPEMKPIGHTAHDTELENELKVPAEHAAQVALPSESAYVPAAQGRQAVARSLEYSP